MAGFHATSEYVKTCLVLVLCILITLAVSYGAPYWTTRPDGHAGLWLGCTYGVCYERWDLWTSSWIHATQAFMTLSIMTCFFAGAYLSVFTFHRSYEDDKRMIFMAMIFMGCQCVFNLIAVCIWAGGEHFGSGEALNWPFALACTTFVAAVVTTIFLYVELRRPVK